MTNQLPNCEKARVEDAKLYRYLLNTAHPVGKSKARFFELAGYFDQPEQLRADLLQIACIGSVTKEEPNPEGTKFVVVGTIAAPNGRTYELLTVWAVEVPANEPRLITAYPNA